MSSTLGHRPELLAPAGDWDAMRAAVANGADAVYFGLSDFNARHRATNFRVQELPEVVTFLHGHNVRGYVTFNTLIFSDELEKASEFLRAVAMAGVDAVIVQDLGVAQLIHQIAPGLHVHGSTQMTLTEPRGIETVHSLGVSRVILARELSATDITTITQKTDVPVEVFVHGALCVAYSGQCLTSESLGGRSANRGQCAQACRLPYELIVDGDTRDLGELAYLLSPQDLAAYDLIGDLLNRGVISFKIEGRLKSAHYVAATTQAYRAALDAALAQQPFTLTTPQRLELEQSFSRGFSQGFLGGLNHQVLVNGRFPKSRGVRLGSVVAVTQHGIIVDIDAQHAGTTAVKPGDGVCFDQGHPEQDEQGGRVFEARPVRHTGRECTELLLGEGDVSLAAIELGSIVWKTDDPALKKKLEQSFSRDVVVRREPVSFELLAIAGRRLQVTVRDAAGHEAVAESPDVLAVAQKHPFTLEAAKKQLNRLGDTPFELGDVKLHGAAGVTEVVNVMVPTSVLNAARREATMALIEQRKPTRTVADAAAVTALRDEAARVCRDLGTSENAIDAPPAMNVLTRSLAQLRAAVAWQPEDNSLRPAMVACDFEDIRQYREAVTIARDAGLPIALATTRIIKPSEEGLLRQVAACEPDAVLVRNLAGLSFFTQEHPNLRLIGDYSLNVANELTAAIFVRAGLRSLVPSYDLNWQQLTALITKAGAALWEVVIHQHMPMFHTEHCVFAHTLSNGADHRTCGRPCDTHKVDLRDRVGVEHALIADVGCRNTVYNGQAQSAAELVPKMLKLGLRTFRVELLRQDENETIALLERYRSILDSRETPAQAVRQLHVLSQLGVTRGTFDFG
jgi:U32 family peptidase